MEEKFTYKTDKRPVRRCETKNFKNKKYFHSNSVWRPFDNLNLDLFIFSDNK